MRRAHLDGGVQVWSLPWWSTNGGRLVERRATNHSDAIRRGQEHDGTVEVALAVAEVAAQSDVCNCGHGAFLTREHTTLKPPCQQALWAKGLPLSGRESSSSASRSRNRPGCELGKPTSEQAN